jgi:hypothetical protein
MYLADDKSVKTLKEPKVNREAFPLQWKAYLGMYGREMDRIRDRIVKEVEGE